MVGLSFLLFSTSAKLFPQRLPEKSSARIPPEYRRKILRQVDDAIQFIVNRMKRNRNSAGSGRNQNSGSVFNKFRTGNIPVRQFNQVDHIVTDRVIGGKLHHLPAEIKSVSRFIDGKIKRENTGFRFLFAEQRTFRLITQFEVILIQITAQ